MQWGFCGGPPYERVLFVDNDTSFCPAIQNLKDTVYGQTGTGMGQNNVFFNRIDTILRKI